MTSFPQITPALAQALETKGYTALTPVQAAVVADDARARDLLVSAQTGSGKTVAFGLAMADELLVPTRSLRAGSSDVENPDREAVLDGRISTSSMLLEPNVVASPALPAPGLPLALVIAPTRELALQVAKELTWLYGKAGPGGTDGRIATCVGGMDPSRERRTLSHGAHIVVGTPGRLKDHAERGALDLSAVRVTVLDEADEMLDMGFREDLEALLDQTPAERRTMMFSATLPRPIVQLAKTYQRDAHRVSTVGEDRGHGDISYQAVAVAPADIEHAVINLLRFHEAETAMLFCATRDNVRHLHASLTERGFAAVALSGEHSQNERNHALQALRDRRARVCVATDVAARGIDLPTLSLVIHVELPRDAETLQHRSGRTGRAGKKGTAVLVVPYPRRKRVEMMLKQARIAFEWTQPPSPESIRAQDRERLLATLLTPVEAEDDDRALAERLLAERSAEDIAVALIQSHRAKLPAPEELIDRAAVPTAHHRAGFEDIVWFRMNIGRRQNADPRWVLPLICRRGHITKTEVGQIRIGAGETQFQVPRAIAARFLKAVEKSADPNGEDEAGVTIEVLDGPPTSAPQRTHGGPPRHQARPTRSGPPKGRGPKGPRGRG